MFHFKTLRFYGWFDTIPDSVQGVIQIFVALGSIDLVDLLPLQQAYLPGNDGTLTWTALCTMITSCSSVQG